MEESVAGVTKDKDKETPCQKLVLKVGALHL